MDNPRRMPPGNAPRSNPLMIPLIVVGGLMGVFAGYGVLAMIRDHGFKLEHPVEVMNEKPTDQQSVTTSNLSSTRPPIEKTQDSPARETKVPKPETLQSATSATEVRVQPEITARKRPRRRGTPASEASLTIATNNTPPQMSLPPPEDPTISAMSPPEEPEQKASQGNAHGDSKASSAVVPMKLTQGVIRVIAIPENVPADSLLCDIGFSPELTEQKNLASSDYVIVAERLDRHGEYMQELPLHIDGAGAAIEIKIRTQNKAAICEIRPKFSLPMSGIQQLTVTRGTALQNSLSRSLNDAIAARDALPKMRTNLGNLQSDLAAAQQATTQPGANPADTGLLHHNATMAITRLNRAIGALNKDIARSERLVADEPAFRTDLDDLNTISQYAQSIASSATISVRFYNGDDTIPATVK